MSVSLYRVLIAHYCCCYGAGLCQRVMGLNIQILSVLFTHAYWGLIIYLDSGERLRSSMSGVTGTGRPVYGGTGLHVRKGQARYRNDLGLSVHLLISASDS